MAPTQNSSAVPRQWGALLVLVLLCFATAGLGAYWTSLSVDTWYATLQKPTWNPPSWLFGPVWTALYLAMAVAAWLVWRRRAQAAVKFPLTLFFVQLLLNCLWSGLFFGMRNPGLAFADIVLLWLAILATMLLFVRISAGAALLLLPYLAWVSFAAALNWEIWRLNA